MDDYTDSMPVVKREHPVRAILAAATVEGCLRQHNSKFEREASRVREFPVDLLKAVRATIDYNATTF